MNEELKEFSRRDLVDCMISYQMKNSNNLHLAPAQKKWVIETIIKDIEKYVSNYFGSKIGGK